MGYAAQDWATCLAEVYQANREVRVLRRDPFITGFELTRSLWLLDLRDTWVVRIGASHTLNTGPEHVCRAWSRSLRAAYPDVDGLATVSAMTGRPSCTLYAPAVSALPAHPGFSMPLAHGGLRPRILAAADEIGYTVA